MATPSQLARRVAALVSALAAGWCSGTAADDNTPTGAGIVPVSRDYTVRIWRQEHGLPDNRIFSLLIARDGFLWAGTRRGVVRFDGVRFVTYSRSTHRQFVSEEITALAEDKAGSIWVGTTSGLVLLGAEIRRFDLADIQIPDPPSDALSVPANVTDMVTARDGRLVVATRLGLFTRLPEGTWRRERLPGPSSSYSYVAVVAEDRNGNLWAGTPPQLYRQAAPDLPWTEQLPEIPGTEEHFTQAVAVGPNGDTFAIIGSWTYQTGRLHRRVGKEWRVESEETIRNEGSLPWLYADPQGDLWHPLDNHILVHRRGTSTTRYQLPWMKPGDRVLSIAQDEAGTLWLGTDRGGLVCLEPRHLKTLTTAEGLPSDNCRALLEASDGALWVGTDGGAVRLVPSADGGFEQPTVVGPKNIRALTEDLDHRIWIGSGTGLLVWEPTRTTELRFEGDWFRTKIRCLTTAPDGTVWVGAAKGLHRVQGAAVQSWFAPQDLPCDDVRVILADPHGRVWIGTAGGGLSRFESGRFIHFGEADGLASFNVWALHEDGEGTLWIGTDRGLGCLRNGGFANITTEQLLPDNLVNGVIEDNGGFLWIGHDRGIYRVASADLLAVATGRLSQATCITYGETDGLPSVETNGQISYPAALRLRDGRIAFATVGGVALFDPNDLPDDRTGPTPHIERLNAEGVTLFANAPGARHAESLDGPLPPQQVPPGQNRMIEIEFTAISFYSGDQTHFRYRLLGLSDEWVNAVGTLKATYAHLRPGPYVFEVEAANRHNQWSPQPERLAFQVMPRLYERAGIQVAAALGLLVCGYGVVRWRLRELRRLKDLETQAALTEERARLARDLHDGLGANLTELTLLSGAPRENALSAEEIRHRFQQLTERTQTAMRSLRDLIWTANPQADSLEGLISRICQQSEHSLEAANIQCRLELPDTLPTRAVGSRVRREVLLACNEALHNAIRHANARQVRIAFLLEPSRLQIRIEDDGQGFAQDPTAQRTAPADRGLGLPNLNRRMASLGGSSEIQSQVGHGTRVTLSVPI